MPIQYERMPKRYEFIVNGSKFTVMINPSNDEGIDPRDILIRDLEACIQELHAMPLMEMKEPFKLPPVKPGKNDGSKGT